jgi:hypothetical protein
VGANQKQLLLQAPRQCGDAYRHTEMPVTTSAPTAKGSVTGSSTEPHFTDKKTETHMGPSPLSQTPGPGCDPHLAVTFVFLLGRQKDHTMAWSLAQGSHPGLPGNVWLRFQCHSWGHTLEASGGWRTGTLLNTLQCCWDPDLILLLWP